MKITKLCLLLVAAVFVSFAAKAQTADDIIGKYTDAIGGKDKLSQIKSVSMEATVSVMGGDNPASTTLLVGKGYLSQAEINGSKIIQCYTDKGGWSINPFAGGSDATAMPDDQYQTGKDQIFVGGALLNYAALGGKAELLGKDGNNYKIKTTVGSTEKTYFIDATSYLLTKMAQTVSMQGQSADVTTTLSDYRKTDFGYMAPFKIDVDLGQIQLGYVVKSITVNKDIDPKIFDMPK
ncbi:MAG TPA: hypothetical protein VG367_18850 [Mucilaginibacter sp.]|nr:hypothetical protein [Mucilaginibacter sp.]